MKALHSLLRGLAVLLFVFTAATVAHAQERGTAAEAEAMVKRAVAYVKAHGREKAADEFTNGSTFKDRDLYISFYDMQGRVLAHGANPKLIGKELIGLKDPDGKPFVAQITEIARTKGAGWGDNYRFRDPLTNKLAEKAAYVERVGDAWVAVGIYR